MENVMDRVRRLKLLLWTITGLATAIGMTRFIFGLGSTTNLSDAYPWGFWIGFDVMGGVALAAGGFVITAIVYIFKGERFHGIVKPAVLTAFLGYLAVIIGLLFDLGLPWNIWHMIIYWNHHSPLFEVGWCVMLYTAVLLLEFSPVPLEPFSSWAKIRRFLIKYRMLLVLLGISLSTLHQSSLGSLFLIMPYKLHPLWYSPILPILFFISAVSLGLMMVCWENLFTSYIYRRKPESPLIAQLASAARWVMLFYLAIRFGDLAIRGQLQHIAKSDFHTYMFWGELFFLAILPIILISLPRVRYAAAGQWFIASSGVFGVVFNRTNVGGLTQIVQEGFLYTPAWTEFIISAGVVAFAGLAFLFFVERFKVWEERPADPSADPTTLPEFDRAGNATLGAPAIAAWTKYSLAFILAMAVGFMLLSGKKVSSRGIEPTGVHPARGGDTLWIDGNLDGYGVAFPHEAHQQKSRGEKSCVRCHHLNLPGDRNSECAYCHSDMYLTSDAFRHDWHASSSGAKIECLVCHRKGMPKNAESVAQDIKDCSHCHLDLFPENAPFRVTQFKARGYVEAMHALCLNCHKKKVKESEQTALKSEMNAATGNIDLTQESEQSYKDLARCYTCHLGELRDFVNTANYTPQPRGLVGKRVILPKRRSK